MPTSRRRSLVPRAIGALLLVLAVMTGAGRASAAAPIEVTASATSGLQPDQEVLVRAVGLRPGAPTRILQCANADAAGTALAADAAPVCSFPGTTVRADAAGAITDVPVVVRDRGITSEVTGATGSCAASAPGPCHLLVIDGSSGARGTLDLHFAAPAPEAATSALDATAMAAPSAASAPALPLAASARTAPTQATPTATASPTTGLSDGQTIQVGGSGLAPGADYAILQCYNADASGQPLARDAQNCAAGAAVVGKADASGNVAPVPFTVRQSLTTGLNSPKTCIEGGSFGCYVSIREQVAGAPAGKVTLHFGSGTTSTTAGGSTGGSAGGTTSSAGGLADTGTDARGMLAVGLGAVGLGLLALGGSKRIRSAPLA